LNHSWSVGTLYLGPVILMIPVVSYGRIRILLVSLEILVCVLDHVWAGVKISSKLFVWMP